MPSRGDDRRRPASHPKESPQDTQGPKRNKSAHKRQSQVDGCGAPVMDENGGPAGGSRRCEYDVAPQVSGSDEAPVADESFHPFLRYRWIRHPFFEVLHEFLLRHRRERLEVRGGIGEMLVSFPVKGGPVFRICDQRGDARLLSMRKKRGVAAGRPPDIPCRTDKMWSVTGLHRSGDAPVSFFRSIHFPRIFQGHVKRALWEQ